MPPSTRHSQQKAKRRVSPYTAVLEDRVKIEKDSVAKLGSCNALARPRHHLDYSLDRIHDAFIKGKGRFQPSSLANISSPVDETLKQLRSRLSELSPSTKDGLVYLAISLSVSLNLIIDQKRLRDSMYDVCVILPHNAPMVLTVIKTTNIKSGPSVKYNCSLTKALIHAVRQYTKENFNALYGVVMSSELESAEAFGKALLRIEKESSFFSIPETLSMNAEKYKSVTKAFFAVAAATDVVELTCSDNNDNDKERRLWFLTKEQFHVLSENIDKNIVNVSTKPSTGSTVLMLEVASRLQKSGRTLLVSEDEEMCHRVKKQKLLTHVMSAEEFRSRSKTRKYLPSRVHHIVCEGSLLPENVHVPKVWSFIKDTSENDSGFESSSP